MAARTRTTAAAKNLPAVVEDAGAAPNQGPEVGATPAPPANANLALWKQLAITDPKATKPFTKSGGFRGTQIDPTWRVMRMTEVFGPVGEGWGYEIMDTRVESGMVFCMVRAWYVRPGQTPDFGGDDGPFYGHVPRNARFTGPQWGGTEIAPLRSGKNQPSDECFKMSVTDALGKCLVQIGVAADVHLGLFDDSKYRDMAEEAYAQKERSEGKAAEEEQFRKDKARADKIVFDVRACKDVDELGTFTAGIADEMKAIGQRNAGLATMVRGAIKSKRDALLADQSGDGQ